MNVQDKKPIKNLNITMQKIIKNLQVFDYPIELKGSSSLQSQKYFSDYDLFCNITNKETPQQLYDEFIKNFTNILKDTNTYFFEFKIQTKKGQKIRWYNLDEFNFEEFYNVYNDIDFCKIDIATMIDYQFFEVSCIYQLSKKQMNQQEYIKMLKEDIKELKKEKKHYKALKRQFNIYKAQKKDDKLIMLTDIFNSELGQKYQTLSNLETIQKLLNITNDDNTIKKIIINLKALKLNPNVKEIDNMINKLSNEINQQAKNIKI